MELAGVAVREALVLELVLALRNADYGVTAGRLEDGLRAFDGCVSLTIEDRDALSSVLDTRRSELNQLHLVLLNEAKWRREIGLEEPDRHAARTSALATARERLARSLDAAERANRRILRSQHRIRQNHQLLADLDRARKE